MSQPNESTVTVSGIAYTTHFSSAAAAYALQKDEFNNFRFEVRSGDAADADINSGNSGTERSEIGQNIALDQSKIVNVSYLQMLPSGSDAVNGLNLFALGQLHHTPDAGDVNGVAPLLCHSGDYTQIIARGAASKPTVQNPPIVAACFEASPTRETWTAYRWRFKYDPLGFLQVFRNGLLIIDYNGPFGYNNIVGPTVHFGVYRAATSETIIVYYSAPSVSYE